MKNNIANAESVNDSAQDALDIVEKKVIDTLGKARETSDELAEKASDAEEKLQKTIQSASTAVSEFIVEKPLQAAGIAFTAGVLVTLLLSRK